MENPLTPSGIEPSTFRFVAQHLNHCATAVPHFQDIVQKYNNSTLNYNHFNFTPRQLYIEVPYLVLWCITVPDSLMMGPCGRNMQEYCDL